MSFEKIVLTSKGVTVSGELVLESSTHWQVAVGGKVGVYSKRDWHKGLAERPNFSDLFGGLFG